MIKVCQRPELIQALEHGLTFADDATVNNALLTKYSLWEYLTPCDADNVNILNACIQRWRDEANKLYETTRLSYDPTLNYNIEEKGKDERTPDLTDERSPDLTDEISYNSTVTGAETGYDVPRTFEDTTKTTNGGKDTTTHKGKETLTKKGKETTEHGRTRAGTIGATQDLIAKERQIIVDCVSWYVEKFNQCFTVSLDINDYCGPCDLDPIADFLPPACDTPTGTITGRLDVIDNEIGALGQQLGDCCENMGAAIDELKKSSRDSKALLAGTITEKGVPTADNATFQTMADNIAAIPTGGNWVKVADWDFTQSRYDTMNNLDIYIVSGVTIDSSGIVSGGYAQRGFGLSNVYTDVSMRYDFEFSYLSDTYVITLPTNQNVRILTFYRSNHDTGTIYKPSVDSGLTGIKLQYNGFVYDLCDDFSEIAGHVLTIEFLPAATYKNGYDINIYIDGVLKCSNDPANGYYSHTPTASDYIVVARTQNTTPFTECYGVNYICTRAKVYKGG